MDGRKTRPGHVEVSVLLRYVRDGTARLLPSGAFLLDDGRLFTSFGNPTSHGKSAYGNWLCRCDVCLTAARRGPRANAGVPSFSGDELRAVRKARALRGEDVAQAAGISPSYLCQLEKGDRRPSPGIVERLASSLGIPAAALVTVVLEGGPSKGKGEEPWRTNAVCTVASA